MVILDMIEEPNYNNNGLKKHDLIMLVLGLYLRDLLRSIDILMMIMKWL